MTSDPTGASVERAISFDLAVSESFDAERSVDGRRPSRDDFESDLWPVLLVQLSVAWREGHPLGPEHQNVMQYVTAPHGAFPPASVLYSTGSEPESSTVIVRALYIEFDWDFGLSPD